MKRKWILTLGAGLAIGAVSLATTQGLVRLEPRSAPASLQDDEREGWARDLSQPDLDLREQAYDRALSVAARQPGLRSALEAWARGERGPELAWTARLILRELDRAGALHGLGVPQGRPGWGSTVPDMEELWRRMAEMHGSLEDLFGMGPGLDLQDLGEGASLRSQGFQLQVGPDGVECEVTTEEDGRRVTRRYEAGSLEELLELHPELRERVELQGRLPLPAQPGDARPPAPERDTSSGTQVLRTDILGVAVTALSPERGAALGLPVGQGLSVERVEPGTLADALGVRRGHVLVELNGRPLRASEDISAVMAERAPDGDLRLVVLDRFGQQRTRVWKPEPPAGQARGSATGPERGG